MPIGPVTKGRSSGRAAFPKSALATPAPSLSATAMTSSVALRRPISQLCVRRSERRRRVASRHRRASFSAWRIQCRSEQPFHDKIADCLRHVRNFRDDEKKRTIALCSGFRGRRSDRQYISVKPHERRYSATTMVVRVNFDGNCKGKTIVSESTPRPSQNALRSAVVAYPSIVRRKMDMQARPKKGSPKTTPEDTTTSLLISVALALAVLLVVVAIERAQPLQIVPNEPTRSAHSSFVYSAATPSR
jgi:hypothetical protein